MTKEIMLDARLSTVASLIRDGVTLYDIGSDHAYLPVSLILSGKIPFAYACDVARGPLSKAEATVSAHGVADKCRLCLSDGMKSVDVIAPCDISIAGMGGELIASIIDAEPSVRNSDIRLILQPMTRGEELRKYLSENGFEILYETTVFEGKYYTVISARYTGEKHEMTPTELVLGREGIREENAEFFAMAKNKLDVISSIYDGKKRGGADCSYEENLICEIKKTIRNGE